MLDLLSRSNALGFPVLEDVVGLAHLVKAHQCLEY